MQNHPEASGSGASQPDNADLTSPTNLRKLVLNYLIHHCYIDTAHAFAQDGISGSMISGNASAVASGSADGSATNGTSGQPGKSSTSSSHGFGPASRRNLASSSRGGPSHGSSHPLSAPPLSRDDSSMEIEVDSLLSLAQHNAAAAGNNEKDESVTSTIGASDEDAAMRDPSDDTNNAGSHASGSTSNGISTKRLNGHDRGELDGGIGPELSAQDLHMVRLRKEIRDHILNGRIKYAIDLLNANFPTVLNSSPEGTSSGASSHARGSVTTSTSTRHSTSHGHASSKRTERALPANPTSLEPSHLSLNLQIQAFIESVRAASTTSTSSPTLAPTTLPSLATTTPGIAAASISRAASPAPSSASSTGSNASNGTLHPVLGSALSHAQSLFAAVQHLPPYWRAMYLKELENVTALLAYTDLERSPVRKYLDQTRRAALAEQINSAIMFRTDRPSQPLIESAVRQTTFVWSQLHNEKVPVPQGHPLLSSNGAPTDIFDSSAGSSRKGGKVLPAWELSSFLAER